MSESSSVPDVIEEKMEVLGGGKADTNVCAAAADKRTTKTTQSRRRQRTRTNSNGTITTTSMKSAKTVHAHGGGTKRSSGKRRQKKKGDSSLAAVERVVRENDGDVGSGIGRGRSGADDQKRKIKRKEAAGRSFCGGDSGVEVSLLTVDSSSYEDVGDQHRYAVSVDVLSPSHADNGGNAGDETTVTTAPVTTDGSSSWSIVSNINNNNNASSPKLLLASSAASSVVIPAVAVTSTPPEVPPTSATSITRSDCVLPEKEKEPEEEEGVQSPMNQQLQEESQQSDGDELVLGRAHALESAALDNQAPSYHHQHHPESSALVTATGAGGPFVPAWPIVENLVDELCSPVYCINRTLKRRTARRSSSSNSNTKFQRHHHYHRDSPSCWEMGGPLRTASDIDNDCLLKEDMKEKVLVRNIDDHNSDNGDRAEQILNEHLRGGELHPACFSNSLLQDDIDDDTIMFFEEADQDGDETSSVVFPPPFATPSVAAAAAAVLFREEANKFFDDDDVVPRTDRQVQPHPFVDVALKGAGEDDTKQNSESNVVIGSVEDLQLPLATTGASAPALDTERQSDKKRQSLVHIERPFPRPPLLSKLFGELMCRIYLRKVAHFVGGNSNSSGGCCIIRKSPRRPQEESGYLPAISSNSIQSSFIFSPQALSLLLEHTTTPSSSSPPLSYFSDPTSINSSAEWDDDLEKLQIHHAHKLASSSALSLSITQQSPTSNSELEKNPPVKNQGKVRFLEQHRDENVGCLTSTAPEKEKDLMDDDSFWEISESGVMTPATCTTTPNSNSRISTYSTTIFVDTTSAKIVEEGASLFADEDLRAFLIMTKDGNDAEPIFPTFSQGSHNVLEPEAQSVHESDDGLQDEIVALGTAEEDLRAELETADLVIKGVLERTTCGSKNSSKSSSTSITTADSMEVLSDLMKDEEGNRVILGSRSRDQGGSDSHRGLNCSTSSLTMAESTSLASSEKNREGQSSDKLASSDESSMLLSVDTDILPSLSTEETSLSLRKVHFSTTHEEYIFFSERGNKNEEGEDSFQDFLCGTFAEIQASFADIFDEMGCRPISFSTSNCSERQCLSKNEQD